ncbi:CAAX prenyl protease [Physocladia obscura]|uniref:CAAX prenyl protease n=1 Tax=Physocladia obscura TaxID=109957 RepID=A0AAD5SQZ2_9FUNG|nr:CAAX prenyl protease [Physocladia obscura]
MLQAAMQHKGVRLIVLGWTGFIAENVIVSEHRAELVAMLGSEKIYKAAYASLSTAACAATLWGYGAYGHRQGPRVKPAGHATRLAIVALQALGAAGLVHQYAPKLNLPLQLSKATIPQTNNNQSSNQPSSQHSIQPASGSSWNWSIACPIDFAYEKKQHTGLLGLQRITRHPQLFSLAFLSLGAALASPFLTARLLFTFPAVFAVIGGAHQDRRFVRDGKWSQEFIDKTSLIPFVALVDGRQQWSVLWNELKHVNIGVGAVGAIVFAFFRKSPSA